MVDGLQCTDSLVGVQGDKPCQQVNLQFVQSWCVLVHRHTAELGEGRLKVFELQSVWPVLFVRGAKYAENFENLVNLRIAHEERFSLHHLCENTPGRPQIDTQGVCLLAKQNFRATVPQSHHFVSVGLNWQPKRSSQSKVR